MTHWGGGSSAWPDSQSLLRIEINREKLNARPFESIGCTQQHRFRVILEKKVVGKVKKARDTDFLYFAKHCSRLTLTNETKKKCSMVAAGELEKRKQCEMNKKAALKS